MIIYYEPDGTVKMNYELNEEIKKDKIPDNLTELHFCNSYNLTIKPDILPINLQKIYFGNNFNKKILPNTIPENVSFIELGTGFSQQIECNTLPSNLSHLIFKGGYIYNIVLNTIPKKLSYLSFYYNKYEINEFVLPSSLKFLRLGYNYNYEFKKNVLPNNLKCLVLGGIYSYVLKEIPKTLKTLYIIGSIENEKIINNLPDSIKTIIFYNLEFTLTNININVEKIFLICYTDEKKTLLKNIPFNCKIFNKYHNQIII
jgi:hypothetical protein